MPHTPLEFHIHPITLERSVTGRAQGDTGTVTVNNHDVDYWGVRLIENDNEHEPAQTNNYLIFFNFELRGSINIEANEADKNKLLGFFGGDRVELDENGVVTSVMPNPDVPVVPVLPELQLVQDPVIYNRPETGLSQETNRPYFRFHNPNGKSAITIAMEAVDSTRFDSLPDDTHQYVVTTRARIEIRCVCTVAEQLGLEFRFRGPSRIISAAESNNVRLITESRENPSS